MHNYFQADIQPDSHDGLVAIIITIISKNPSLTSTSSIIYLIWHASVEYSIDIIQRLPLCNNRYYFHHHIDGLNWSWTGTLVFFFTLSHAWAKYVNYTGGDGGVVTQGLKYFNMFVYRPLLVLFCSLSQKMLGKMMRWEVIKVFAMCKNNREWRRRGVLVGWRIILKCGIDSRDKGIATKESVLSEWGAAREKETTSSVFLIKSLG